MTSFSVNAPPEFILNQTGFTISSTSEKGDHTMHESSECKQELLRPKSEDYSNERNEEPFLNIGAKQYKKNKHTRR